MVLYDCCFKHSRDRTDDLIVANDEICQYSTSVKLGSFIATNVPESNVRGVRVDGLEVPSFRRMSARSGCDIVPRATRRHAPFGLHG